MQHVSDCERNFTFSAHAKTQVNWTSYHKPEKIIALFGIIISLRVDYEKSYLLMKEIS